LRVVGVAGDAQWRGITDDPELFLYLPFGDRAIGLRDATLLVQSALPMRDVVARVNAVAAELDPSLPVQFSRTLSDGIDRALSDQRVFAWMFSLLGALGFALAAVGVYGLLAQGVGERTREFGLRMALGSTRGGVFGLVLRQAGWIGAIGTALGLGAGYFGSRLVESQLYGVTRTDPLVYAVSAAALAVVVLAAAVIPARTATRIQPMEALRTD
jgi:ABC-type antimicrobial peptide transport system permease subunit